MWEDSILNDDTLVVMDFFLKIRWEEEQKTITLRAEATPQTTTTIAPRSFETMRSSTSRGMNFPMNHCFTDAFLQEDRKKDEYSTWVAQETAVSLTAVSQKYLIDNRL